MIEWISMYPSYPYSAVDVLIVQLITKTKMKRIHIQNLMLWKSISMCCFPIINLYIYILEWWLKSKSSFKFKRIQIVCNTRNSIEEIYWISKRVNKYTNKLEIFDPNQMLYILFKHWNENRIINRIPVLLFIYINIAWINYGITAKNWMDFFSSQWEYK